MKFLLGLIVIATFWDNIYFQSPSHYTITLVLFILNKKKILIFKQSIRRISN